MGPAQHGFARSFVVVGRVKYRVSARGAAPGRLNAGPAPLFAGPRLSTGGYFVSGSDACSPEAVLSKAYDLVVRGAVVFDGTGRAPFEADVAVKDGRVAAVGRVAQAGVEEIDARGKVVTPGFVDIHTHYDGQATWGDRMQPSSFHGVTTVVMGNCGVGFAPCRPEDHDRLVPLMDGVEDIPFPVLTEGLPWNWESYPDYLDKLAERRFDVDIGSPVP